MLKTNWFQFFIILLFVLGEDSFAFGSLEELLKLDEDKSKSFRSLVWKNARSNEDYVSQYNKLLCSPEVNKCYINSPLMVDSEKGRDFILSRFREIFTNLIQACEKDEFACYKLGGLYWVKATHTITQPLFDNPNLWISNKKMLSRFRKFLKTTKTLDLYDVEEAGKNKTIGSFFKKCVASDGDSCMLTGYYKNRLKDFSKGSLFSTINQYEHGKMARVFEHICNLRPGNKYACYMRIYKAQLADGAESKKYEQEMDKLCKENGYPLACANYAAQLSYKKDAKSKKRRSEFDFLACKNGNVSSCSRLASRVILSGNAEASKYLYDISCVEGLNNFECEDYLRAVLQKDKNKENIKVLNEVCKREYQEACLLLYSSQFIDGKRDNAIKGFGELCGNGNLRACRGLAQAFFRKNMTVQAKSVLEESCRSSDEINVCFELGMLLSAQGKQKAALFNLKRLCDDTGSTSVCETYDKVKSGSKIEKADVFQNRFEKVVQY
jgi:hypothetical protein